MQYDVGDLVPLRHLVRDTDGALTAATVTLLVIAPDGTTSAPAVSSASTGVYTAQVPATQAKQWSYVWTVSGPVVDVAAGFFDVGDPAPPAYATLDQLKAEINISDSGRDALLARKLISASRGVDEHCGRRFYLDRTATARTYSPRGRTTPEGLLLVDDIGTDAGLTVEVGSGSGWTAVDDVHTWPDNALARGYPITGLTRQDGSPLAAATQRVRVTARWGWPAVPDVVVEATLLQAARLYKRRDSPEGVAGNAEWGVVRVSRIDPDVQALLAHLVIPGVG